MATTAQAVPRAHAGPITDDILENAISIARGAADEDRLSSAGAALLLYIAGPALEELLQWRRRARLIRELSDTDNVIFLPGNPGT